MATEKHVIYRIQGDARKDLHHLIADISNAEGRSRLQRIVNIVEKRKMEDDPFVHAVVDTLANGHYGILHREVESENIAITGSFNNKNDALTIKIDAIYDIRLMNDKRRDLDVNSGFSASFPKVLYAVLKGAASRAEIEGLKKVTVIAGSVVNSMLKKMFTEIGFVSIESGLPLTPSSISGPERNTMIINVTRT